MLIGAAAAASLEFQSCKLSRSRVRANEVRMNNGKRQKKTAVLQLFTGFQNEKLSVSFKKDNHK